MNISFKKPQLEEIYYNFLFKVHGYDKIMKILTVDFEKPWWDVLWQQKFLFLLIALAQVFTFGYDTLMPLLLGLAVSTLDYRLLAGVLLGKVLLSALSTAIMYFNPIFQIQTMNSVAYSANKFFLLTDPINHSTRSSGQIFSKTEKGSASFEDVLDIFTFELFPFFINVLVVCTSLLLVNIKLGLIALISLFLIGFVNVVLELFRIGVFEKRNILFQDRYLSIAVETLQQTQYIRATFAAPEQLRKMAKFMLDFMCREGLRWRANAYNGLLTRILYSLSTFILGWQILVEVQNNHISGIVATSLILTYWSGTNNVTKLGDYVKRLGRSMTRIDDLFSFIRSFGKQTYPVLPVLEGEIKN